MNTVTVRLSTPWIYKGQLYPARTWIDIPETVYESLVSQGWKLEKRSDADTNPRTSRVKQIETRAERQITPDRSIDETTDSATSE